MSNPVKRLGTAEPPNIVIKFEKLLLLICIEFTTPVIVGIYKILFLYCDNEVIISLPTTVPALNGLNSLVTAPTWL